MLVPPARMPVGCSVASSPVVALQLHSRQGPGITLRPQNKMRPPYVLLAASALALLCSTDLQAQPTSSRGGTTATTRPPAVVRLPTAAPSRMPAEMSAGRQLGRITKVDLSQLEVFAGLTATSSFVLNPSRMYEHQRGMLRIHGQVKADVDGGFAYVDRDSDGPDVRVTIYGVPGRTYVLDIVAEPSCGTSMSCLPFTLQARMQAGATHSIEFREGNPHALLAFTAPSAGWYDVVLESTESWIFRSATVSQLQ
jgi:hypothetical protein